MKKRLDQETPKEPGPQNPDNIFGKRAESKLLKDEAKEMNSLTRKANTARKKELGKNEVIYKEREVLNALFENEDEEGVRAIEKRGQTMEEKVAALEVAESKQMPIDTNYTDNFIEKYKSKPGNEDKDPVPPYGIPSFLETDEGRLFFEAQGYGIPVNFSDLESVKF